MQIALKQNLQGIFNDSNILSLFCEFIPRIEIPKNLIVYFERNDYNASQVVYKTETHSKIYYKHWLDYILIIDNDLTITDLNGIILLAIKNVFGVSYYYLSPHTVPDEYNRLNLSLEMDYIKIKGKKIMLPYLKQKYTKDPLKLIRKDSSWYNSVARSELYYFGKQYVITLIDGECTIIDPVTKKYIKKSLETTSIDITSEMLNNFDAFAKPANDKLIASLI